MANLPFRGGDQTLESPADDAAAPQESTRRPGAASIGAASVEAASVGGVPSGGASPGDASGSRDALSGERVDAAPSGDALLGMDCLPAELIDAMLGGMLEPAERTQSYEHLATCRACVERLTRAGELILGGGSLGPGRLVARRYRIIRFVAQGGMGEVYEAYDTELSVRVALKMVPATGEQRPAALRGLAREVLLARSIAHPNVCRIFDLGLHEGDLIERPLRFLTMEFVDGERLSSHIAAGPMALGLVHAIARDLLRGLAAAHRAGVLHRDFKSDNVLLREGTSPVPQAVIMDFGLARSLGQPGTHVSASNHRVEGSLLYMAPEQLQGQALGWETDIFGFGVVLFEMLTGRTPFAEQITLGAAMQRCNAPPPSPSAHVPELPPALERLVQRCMSPLRADRYQSAEATLEALEHAFAPDAPSWSERGVGRAPLLIGFMTLAGLGLEANQLPLQTRELALTPSPPSAAPVPNTRLGPATAVAALPATLPATAVAATPATAPEPSVAAPEVPASAPVVRAPRLTSRPAAPAAAAPAVLSPSAAVPTAPPPAATPPAAMSPETSPAAMSPAAVSPAALSPPPSSLLVEGDDGELLLSELPLSEPSASEAPTVSEAAPGRDRRDTLFNPFMAEPSLEPPAGSSD